MRVDVRRVLIYTHRWLGIGGCVLFITWFASGIVMMYARMPELSDDERLARLQPIDLTTARVSIAGVAGGHADRVRVGMLAGRPFYRFVPSERTVFADTGETLTRVTAEAAVDLVKRFAPEHAATIRYDTYLADPDQWTLSGPARRAMPLHRVALGDAGDSYLYIAERTGEPVMKTTGRARRFAYVGAVLHWIYFTPLRRHGAVWTQTIIWLSIAGCVLCLSGLVWGVWRVSPFSRYRLKYELSHSPYAGFMKWHHYAGLIVGVTTFTWIFSGLLSMDPWGWSPGTSPSRQQRDAVAGGPLKLETVTLEWLRASLDTTERPVEAEVAQFCGEPFLVTNVTNAAPIRFDERAMLAAARAAMPGVHEEDAAWLQDYDPYYYDRDRALPLPVVRVRYADAQRTWLYLDPRRGAIVRKEERVSRVNRWLYHGLHSLDFPFLYGRRPLWDITVIALSLGGIVLSAATVTPAVRRLRRHVRRFQRG